MPPPGATEGRRRVATSGASTGAHSQPMRWRRVRRPLPLHRLVLRRPLHRTTGRCGTVVAGRRLRRGVVCDGELLLAHRDGIRMHPWPTVSRGYRRRRAGVPPGTAMHGSGHLRVLGARPANRHSFSSYWRSQRTGRMSEKRRRLRQLRPTARERTAGRTEPSAPFLRVRHRGLRAPRGAPPSTSPPRTLGAVARTSCWRESSTSRRASLPPGAPGGIR